jgi:hypothetical protein
MEARRILEKADEADITLRLLGGVAIGVICKESTQPEFSRIYGDIDFIGLGDEGKKIRQLFEALGYTPNKTFNGLHGRERLVYYDLEHNRQVDIFLNIFRMCHTFDLRDRLRISPLALPPADLLLTKLQAIEINEKDFKDTACLLKSKNVAPKDDADSINVEYISEICAKDWGIYKTLTTNLKELMGYVENKLKIHQDELRSKTNEIIKNIEEKPKTTGWKMRERIGERKRWYDLPEEKRSQVPISGQVGSEVSDTGHHPEIG